MMRAAAKYRTMTQALSGLDVIIVAASMKIQTMVELSSKDVADPKIKKVVDDLILLHTGLKTGRKHVEDTLQGYPILQDRVFTHGVNGERTEEYMAWLEKDDRAAILFDEGDV